LKLRREGRVLAGELRNSAAEDVLKAKGANRTREGFEK
jgi:hypothetical protein